MKVSKLIRLLQDAQAEHGDLPVIFAGGSEYSPSEVVLVKEGASAVHFGAAIGPHLAEPKRIAIKGNITVP